MQFRTVYSNVPKQNRSYINIPTRTPFKANPISHYRYSLGFSIDPQYKTVSRRTSISAINRPGGIGASSETIKCTDNTTNTTLVTSQVFSEPLCQINKLVYKPATTVLASNYYSDTNGYLKARARSFTQNESNNQVQIHITDSNGVVTSCDANITNSPSNKKYYSNGAVSSGNRIERLKYEAKQRSGMKNISPHFVKNVKMTCCSK